MRHSGGADRQRLATAIRLAVNTRWFYITALIFTGVFSKITAGELSANQNFPAYLMAAIAIFCYILNFLFLYASKHFGQRWLLITSYVQLLVDSSVMIVIVFYAGGIISVSYVYLIYQIIISGFYYRDLKNILVITTFVSLLYGGLIWGQYFGIIPYLPRYNDAFEYRMAGSLPAVLPITFTVISTYYLVGIFIYSFVRNINATEVNLREEKEKSQAIISHLADGLVYIGSDGLVEFMNPQAEKLLGIGAAGVLGRNLKDLAVGETKPLADLYASDEPNRNLLFGHLDVAVKVTTVNIASTEGRPVGTAKIIYDVTREKLVDEMKSQFIMLAGHQLRTPLSAIKFALSLLLEKDFGELNDEQKEVLDKCYNYNERLISLVNDLLDVYSAEEGRFYYQYAPVDVGAMIREVIDRLLLNVGYKDKRVEILLADGLPKISADPQKVKLVLSGILDNAMSYTGPAGKISVAVRPADDKLVIEVADDGIGIAPADKEKIFSKFFRSASALNLKPEGNGLDLYVVRNIVENHGGKISFTSGRERGTIFTILLPVYPKNRSIK